MILLLLLKKKKKLILVIQMYQIKKNQKLLKNFCKNQKVLKKLKLKNQNLNLNKNKKILIQNILI